MKEDYMANSFPESAINCPNIGFPFWHKSSDFDGGDKSPPNHEKQS